MDAVTTAFHARQDDASEQQEQELAPGGTLLQLDDAAAARAGLAVHRTFGVTYGVLATALTRRGGVHPVAAGLAVGAATFVVVDEGTALPLARQYPLVSHLRGVAGHATVGLTTGLLLRAMSR